MTRLIDADALIERLKPYIDKYGAKEFPYYMVQDAFIYEVEQEPTMDAVPVRHGKWIKVDKDNMFFAPHILKCSLCGNILDRHGVNAGRGDANYCPNCGARMDEE